MKNKSKKYFSTFLLVLILSPMITVDIHNYIHRNDLRCHELSFHYHTIQHHCSICDYLAPTMEGIETPEFHSSMALVSRFESLEIRIPHITSVVYLSLRGPPALV